MTDLFDDARVNICLVAYTVGEDAGGGLGLMSGSNDDIWLEWHVCMQCNDARRALPERTQSS